MYFTVEEENLICLYHNADRRRTAANLRAALPGYPAPAKVLLHWECCMQKDHGDIWNLFPPIHGGE